MAYIKMVTDSAADISAQLQKELEIQVLPFPIATEDREYRDGVDLAPEEFYRVLTAAANIPTHSQLTPFQFEECYEQAYEAGYTDLIYTAINGKGSATYTNSVQARQTFYEEHPEAKEKFKIHLIDSGTYSMAYGWAVMEGAKMAAKGVAVEKILAAMKDWIEHTRILVVPLDLRFAKKSGRISAAAAFMGEALGLKPIVTFEDGESKIIAKVRGEKNVVPSMLDICKKKRKKGTPYFVAYGNNHEAGGRLLGASIQELGEQPSEEFYLGGVITINVGPNVIGIIYREK
ncbi:MAG: DegV family protein [Clostridium sp.]|nr:DegV family protein [Clostridium sp.]